MSKKNRKRPTTPSEILRYYANLSTLNPDEQRTLVRTALYKTLRAAFEKFCDGGVRHKGAYYGVTIPDLIAVCKQIAREDHEDIHQYIALCLRDPEIGESYFADTPDWKPGECHLCGKMILATRPVQPFHGITRFNITSDEEEANA